MSNASPFGSRENGSAIWCRIAGGKIVRSATDTTPGAVRVEKKKDGQGTGEFRWELHDEFVLGRIISLRVNEQTFHGEVLRQLVIGMDYKGQRVNLTLKEGDRYWRAFMLRLPNIDLSSTLTFLPYDFEPREGGRRIGLNIEQNGAKVLPKWTKENPGELPQMVYVKFKGKDRPDFTDQDEWLNKNVLLPAGVKLAEMVNAAPVTNDPAASYTGPAPVGEGDDDLPF